MGIDELIKSLWGGTGFQDTGITTQRIATALCLAFVIGCFVFVIYRLVVREGFHSRTFNVVLGAIAPIMAALVLTMQSSLIVSLSSIGALSIIRFRTPIKDPMDLLFLFWSIGSGIMCGAGVYQVALLTTLFVAMCILLLSYVPLKKGPCVLVLNASEIKSEKQILQVVKRYSKHYKVKSRNLTMAGLDLILELKVEKESELLLDLYQIESVHSASLVAHDGDIG